MCGMRSTDGYTVIFRLDDMFDDRDISLIGNNSIVVVLTE